MHILYIYKLYIHIYIFTYINIYKIIEQSTVESIRKVIKKFT